MDDDNAYHPAVWDELRQLRPMRVGVLAVRRAVYPSPSCDGTHGTRSRPIKQLIERPVFNQQTGRLERFLTGWCDDTSWMSSTYGRRTFCLDMGGFAFDAMLLQHVVSLPNAYYI